MWIFVINNFSHIPFQGKIIIMCWLWHRTWNHLEDKASAECVSLLVKAVPLYEKRQQVLCDHNYWATSCKHLRYKTSDLLFFNSEMNQVGASFLREALALNLLLHCIWGLCSGGALYRDALSLQEFLAVSAACAWVPRMEPVVEPVLHVPASTNAKCSHALPRTLLRPSRPAPKALSTTSSPRACQVGGWWWWRSRSPTLQTLVVWQETPGDLLGLSCSVLLQRIFWLQVN